MLIIIQVNVIENGTDNVLFNDAITITAVECCTIPDPNIINQIEDGMRLSEFIDRYNQSSQHEISRNEDNTIWIIRDNFHPDLADIDVFGKFIIDEGVSFGEINFRMAEGSEIIVEPHSAVTFKKLTNPTVLHGCTGQLWKGIRVMPDGNLTIDRSNVEDAEYAVRIESIEQPDRVSSKLLLKKARLFNNFVGVFIESNSVYAFNSHVAVNLRENTIIDGARS